MSIVKFGTGGEGVVLDEVAFFKLFGHLDPGVVLGDAERTVTLFEVL